jgi:predicted membrane channel-forming protein YqfA (hemolysin III family)
MQYPGLPFDQAAAYKLAFPIGLRRLSLVAFAALALFVLFGLQAAIVSMAPPAVGLILAGVALYILGAAIHHRPMPFHTPIRNANENRITR